MTVKQPTNILLAYLANSIALLRPAAISYASFPSLHVVGRVPVRRRTSPSYHQTGATCARSSVAISQHKCAAAFRNHFPRGVGRGAAVEVRWQMLWEPLGPEALFYFRHCGTGSTLCRRKDTCNQPLTPPEPFRVIICRLKSRS